MNVQELLRENHVRFRTAQHRTTATAQQVADALHLPGDNVAKTVVLKADDRYVVAVLQATHLVDMPMARRALAVDSVKLALEHELSVLFPDCELGAIPPFGSRYGLKTLVDVSLAEDEYLVFEGNSHHEAVCMKFADFAELEAPVIAAFSRHL